MSIALIIIHNAPHRFGPRSGSCLRLLCSPFTKAVLPPPPVTQWLTRTVSACVTLVSYQFELVVRTLNMSTVLKKKV